MNSAVALVEAYLHANGYFTVTEYPIIEAMEGDTYRVRTDIDIMAMRLPHARRLIPGRGPRGKQHPVFEPDPQLRPTDDRVDLLIGEVKEGHAVLNEGAKDFDVLKSALSRFGGKASGNLDAVVRVLIRRGEALVKDGPRVRVVAFGSHGAPRKSYDVITLGHILAFFNEMIAEHWDILQHAHFTHPGLGFLMMEEKSRRKAMKQQSRKR
jgi:hypothetical protein